MTREQFRLVMIGLTLLLAAVVAGAVALWPSGEEQELPAAITALDPGPREAVPFQSDLEIQMALGYRIELRIDGLFIPPDELTFVESTGQYRFRPANGLTIDTWTPGDHTVSIVWDRVVGLPDPGAYSWTFRVQ